METIGSCPAPSDRFRILIWSEWWIGMSSEPEKHVDQSSARTAARISASVHQRVDFELRRLEGGKWRLRVISQQALYWMKSMNVGSGEDELYLNLIAANDFLRSVRRHGLTTEYIGPLGRCLL
ncbi:MULTISPECIES: hypothetical protein [Rhizobium]|uniref:hypothetical protein n=1 Tax=Rhizobium sp. 268 TaxID=2996375 RepID=UPI002F9377D7